MLSAQCVPVCLCVCVCVCVSCLLFESVKIFDIVKDCRSLFLFCFLLIQNKFLIIYLILMDCYCAKCESLK